MKLIFSDYKRDTRAMKVAFLIVVIIFIWSVSWLIKNSSDCKYSKGETLSPACSPESDFCCVK